MPTFKYTAKKGPQDTVVGVFEAPSRNEVLSHLASLGYTPVRVEETVINAATVAAQRRAPGPAGRVARVPARHVNVFTRQFASLIRSQIPILRALGIMADQTAHPALRKVLAAMSEEIRQGKTLSEAMEEHPGVFSPLYVNLTRSGEVGGMVDTVLDRLAVKADHDEALRSKVNSALAYPAFVAVVGVGTVMFLLTFVMPRLLKLFAGYERLPLATRMLLAVTKTMSQWWFWAAVIAVIAGLAVVITLKGAQLRSLIDRFSWRIPVIGRLICQLELARFSRSFSLLLEHGVSVLRAVDVAIPVVRHEVIRRQLQQLPAGLKQGQSLAACLKPLSVVTPFVANTIAVGEESGKAGEAFAEVAAYYEREAETLLHTAAALLEPTMILGVGAIVGWIVMAILLPIFELSSIAR